MSWIADGLAIPREPAVNQGKAACVGEVIENPARLGIVAAAHDEVRASREPVGVLGTEGQGHWANDRAARGGESAKVGRCHIRLGQSEAVPVGVIRRSRFPSSIKSGSITVICSNPVRARHSRTIEPTLPAPTTQTWVRAKRACARRGSGCLDNDSGSPGNGQVCRCGRSQTHRVGGCATRARVPDQRDRVDAHHQIERVEKLFRASAGW